MSDWRHKEIERLRAMYLLDEKQANKMIDTALSLASLHGAFYWDSISAMERLLDMPSWLKELSKV